MKCLGQKIEGVKIIEHEPFIDKRGIFTRIYCEKKFEEFGIEKKISQMNLSFNKYEHTLRGFHYQEEPHGEDKTMQCIVGAIFDIVVDIRKDSKTYLQWTSFEFTEKDNLSLHVPKGCANAFLTLKPNTLVHYNSSYEYSPSNEKGIRYNDPLFNFKWKTDPQVISEKDLNHLDYKI